MIENTDIAIIGKYFQDKLIEKCTNSEEYHNHPPVNFIVKNCEYCKKNGNIFKTKHCLL